MIEWSLFGVSRRPNQRRMKKGLFGAIRLIRLNTFSDLTLFFIGLSITLCWSFIVHTIKIEMIFSDFMIKKRIIAISLDHSRDLSTISFTLLSYSFLLVLYIWAA